MKILVVSNMFPDKGHPSYGIFVKNFCDQLAELEVSYQKSVMYKKDNSFKKIWSYLVFFFRTFFMLLIGHYDIVYVHYASISSIPVLCAAHFKKINMYVNVHGSDVVPESGKQERFQVFTKKSLTKAIKVVVPSVYFKKYVQSKYGIASNKIWVYPSGGVSLQTFAKEKSGELIEKYRQKYSIDKDIPTFGMAGRISKGKGWDKFILAIKELNKLGVKANYFLIGNGTKENEEKLNKLIKDSKVTNLIRVGLQPQDKLAIFYNMFDFFVFPTEREGESLGLVALEAMACGTPVIGSDFAAPKYYISDGINGYKFEMGSVQSLTKTMNKSSKIFSDKDEYLKLSNGALQTAYRYSNEKIIDNLKEIIFKEFG